MARERRVYGDSAYASQKELIRTCTDLPWDRPVGEADEAGHDRAKDHHEPM
jgi:hypothetical protein